MSVPGYQEFMLPLIQIAGDCKEHTVSEAMATLAEQMKISESKQAKTSEPESDVLTTAAKAIGTTLGKIAVKTGIAKPPAPAAKARKKTAAKKPAKKTAALAKRTASKKSSPKKSAPKRKQGR